MNGSSTVSVIDQLETLRSRAVGTFIDEVGAVLIDVHEGYAKATLTIEARQIGSNGYSHGGVGASFLGTARAGTLTATATDRHLGKITKMWEAAVSTEGTDRPMLYSAALR